MPFGHAPGTAYLYAINTHWQFRSSILRRVSDPEIIDLSCLITSFVTVLEGGQQVAGSGQGRKFQRTIFCM